MRRADAIAADAGVARAWRRWSLSFLVATLALSALLAGFVAALDPFGLRVSPGRPARPLMDINQRFMYPQLVRSGAFDAAVIGTSTMRLLDPTQLSNGIGGRFANLAMNAATPWEQLQMAQLFLRLVPAPRALIWGVDLPWCDSRATDEKNRLTPRPFPPWLYAEPGVIDNMRQLNWTALEIAGRLLWNRLGLLPERIRGDGYEVFTPPEHLHDLARARAHLDIARESSAPGNSGSAGAAEQAAWRFPALAWLDKALAAMPAGALKLLVLPPSHVAARPREGSAGAELYEACKGALREVARQRGAIVVDYAFGSPLTRGDENYWDALHFRLPIARMVEADLAAVAKGGPPLSDGLARVARPPR